ncbi:hypothetical protein KAH94_04655 [bacterium]|nr:hypothetical protein [bacterium]
MKKVNMYETKTQHQSDKEDLLERLKRIDIVSCGDIPNYINEIKEALIESIKLDIENERLKMRKFNLE